MFSWWSNWRRKRILSSPEPRDLRNTLRGDLWQWHYLPEDVEEAAIEWVRIFCAEKYWEGCGGFRLHDYHRWIIAGQASLMTLAFPDLYFEGCKTLLIYPGDYVAPGITHMLDSQIGIHGEQPRSGQTSYHGPVVLNWSGIQRAARDHNDGHSVTIHELAHQLDFDNGPSADGLPPLPSTVVVERWYRDFNNQLDELRDRASSGYDNLLMDDYGLTNLGELFAVSTELFFQLPHEFARWHSELFNLLLECYQRDWREWLPG